MIDESNRPLPARSAVWDAVSAPYRLMLGLRVAHPDECWLELDEDLASDLREKKELLDRHRDQVFVEIPSSRAAQREALDRVEQTLQQHYPSAYRMAEGRLHVDATGDRFDLDPSSMPPLEVAARCVQEDLVIMERPKKDSEDWALTAGAVCFPTRWDLPSKLGRSMTEIHERVPGYREQLDASANRFFDGMKSSIVYRRANWSLMDDPTLFQPEGKFRNDARETLEASNAGRLVWLRVEHQTLQRLPRTGAILFGIRVHRTRLDDVACEPRAADLLVDAIETMPIEMQRYKSLGMVRTATIGFLRNVIDTNPR